jgi:4-amino-4-deoxy-L-arabinose transferase-like glycosyltransferase
LESVQPRDAWTLRSVFFLAFVARLLALAVAWDADLKFEKFFIAARQLIASGWMPVDAFAYSPAYTYFLAVLMRAGASPVSIALVQAVLGALTCVAICDLARRLFGWREAMVAGAAAALFGPFLIYDISFESDGPGLLLFCLAALALLAAIDRPGAWRFGLAGLLLGLRATQRPDVLSVVPIILLALAIFFGRQWTARRTTGYLAACCGMLLLPIWPIAALNYRATGEIIPVMSSPGWVFYASNNHAATGLSYYPPPLALEWMQGRPAAGEDPMARLDDAASRRIAGLAAGRALSATEASRFWLREGLRSIARRGLFGQIGLQAKKLFYMFHDYEGHDNLALLVMERRLGSLAALGMGLLGPLSLVGLFLAARRRLDLRGRLAAVGALLLAPVLTMCLFYVGPRFRLPLQALLLPFGAFALTMLWDAARRRDWRTAGGAAAAALLLGGALNASWPGIDVQRRSRTVQLEMFLGQRAPDDRTAEAHYHEAARVALYPAEAEAAYRELSRLAGERGNDRAAERYERIATGLLPADRFARLSGMTGDPDALWAIGRHHLLSDDPDAAAAAFAGAARLAPHDPDLLFARAIAAYEADAEPPETVAAWLESALELGLRFSPGAVPAYILAGRCYLELEQRDAAERALNLALRRAPGNEAARALLERAREAGWPVASGDGGAASFDGAPRPSRGSASEYDPLAAQQAGGDPDDQQAVQE